MKYVIQINNLNNNLMIYYIHLLTRFNLVKWISKNYKYDDIVIIDDINNNECIICNICDFPYMFFKNRPKLNQNEYNKILNILHDINDLEIISFYITLLLQFDFSCITTEHIKFITKLKLAHKPDILWFYYLIDTLEDVLESV